MAWASGMPRWVTGLPEWFEQDSDGTVICLLCPTSSIPRPQVTEGHLTSNRHISQTGWWCYDRGFVHEAALRGHHLPVPGAAPAAGPQPWAAVSQPSAAPQPWGPQPWSAVPQPSAAPQPTGPVPQPTGPVPQPTVAGGQSVQSAVLAGAVPQPTGPVPQPTGSVLQPTAAGG